MHYYLTRLRHCSARYRKKVHNNEHNLLELYDGDSDQCTKQRPMV